MNNAQIINDLIMKCAEYKKDAEYLAGERDYWKQQAQSVSDGCDTESYVMPLTRENVEKFRDIVEADTREILEHDCKWMAYAWSPDVFPDDKLEKKLYREIIDKLDRQKEITERECDMASWKANYMHVMKQRDELQEKVDALESELEVANSKKRALKLHISKMQSGRNSWHIKAKQLEAENAKLKEKVDALEAELSRTCSLAYDGKWLTCSECGESLQWFGVRTVYKGDTQERALGVEGVMFCPFCGARIEGGEGE